MALRLPTSVQDPRVQQCLDFLSRQFPIGAGALSAAAKELFPQLATAAATKVNFGIVELEFPGASRESKTSTVTHGLGVSPQAVVLTYKAVAAVDYMFVQSQEYSSTVFKCTCKTDTATPALGTKAPFTWIAIG